jgi:ATP-dependent DNA ligase
MTRNGKLLVNLPFARRREALESLLAAPKDPLRLSPLLKAPSGQILEAVRKLGLEGVVGKRLDQAPHGPRARVRHWRLHPWSTRVRCIARGRLREERVYLRREGEERLCVANSGGNLSRSQKAESCPLLVPNLPEKRASRWGESLTAEKMEECRWVKPKLVCQVAFVEWTDAGHLRHCTFIGMRDDKKPAEVVRET